MLRIFKRELRANLKSVIIWSVSMLALSALGFGEYSIVMGGGNDVDMNAVANMMPRVVRVMFGMGELSVNTPEGWYVCMYLWCAMAAYLHAALLGAGIIAKEESDKTSEFLFTKPIKRGCAVNGKILAGAVYTFVVVLVSWVSAMTLFAPHTGDWASGKFISLSMLGMLITSMVFLMLGVFLSALVSARGKSAGYAAALLLGSYSVYVASEMSSSLTFLRVLSPFCYFDAAEVYKNGLSLSFLLLSAVIAAAAGYLAHVFYAKRNLHS